MDIPRIFNITESAHRIHNPITPEKLATLGAALRLESGARVLDLGSGSGEMLCSWARDQGVIGTASAKESDRLHRDRRLPSVLGCTHLITSDHT
jgi:tRNA A58 N-methylase Trm61